MASESSESDVEFKINEDYAARYDRWREKEEHEKLKARYGDVQNFPSESSSSSESEDENAEELNPEVEKEFLKTLSYLKSKNPVIYDKNTKFFDKQEKNSKATDKVKTKKEKPMYLKDYERQLILEKGGILTDEDDSDADTKQQRAFSPSYVEEQKQLKDSFKQAMEQVDDNQEFLTERKKTKEELEKEEVDFLDWLKGQKDTVDDKKVKKEMKFLHDYWNNPKLDRQEAFLKDFILNKRYLEHEHGDRIPTYDEIVHDSEDLSEDEETLEKQEHFEHKYNFRFEEPDPEFIKHYPRTMKDSLRREDDRRKKKREEVKERKRLEKGRKQEELKQLKAFKRKEILEKLDRLQGIAGNTRVGFDDDDLEGDFDPDAYDRKMKQVFDEDYYEMDCDTEKPSFADEEEDDDIVDWDKWQRSEESNKDASRNDELELHCEDPQFNMDADYNPTNEMLKEMLDSSRNKKKRRKSKFAELASKKKPVYNPDDKTFEEYLDEYYKLDYEDVVGDLPCRFKYRRVPANDFGLTVEEILEAKDNELNRWASLKKTCQYRSKGDELYEIQAYQKKAAQSHMKEKILSSVYGPKNEDEEDQNKSNVDVNITTTKKKKKKKKRKLNKVESNQELAEEGEGYIAPELDPFCNSDAVNDVVLNSRAKVKKTKTAASRSAIDVAEDSSVDTPKKKKSRNSMQLDDQTSDKAKITDAGTAIKEPSDETAVSRKKRKRLGADSDNGELVAKARKLKSSAEDVERGANSKVVTDNNSVSAIEPNRQKQTQKVKLSGKQKRKLKLKTQKNSVAQNRKSLIKLTGLKKPNRNQPKQNAAVSDERLRAYGINPKKFKKKHIWKNMLG